MSTYVAVNTKQARTSSWRIIGDVFLRAAYMPDHCLLLIGEASIIFGVKLMELCTATACTRTWLFIFFKWDPNYFAVEDSFSMIGGPMLTGYIEETYWLLHVKIL